MENIFVKNHLQIRHNYWFSHLLVSMGTILIQYIHNRAFKTLPEQKKNI